ncbi:MAG: sigma-70 family RNA polymerase sigma factor [Bacteroidota bacterium]
MDRNFGLTQERFDQLLEALQNGDDQLFERVFLSHFKSCMQYLIKNYRASQADAYDVTMDTLLVFHKRMKAGKVSYGNLRFLFTQMAGQHYKRWIKKEAITTDALDISTHDLPEKILDKTDTKIFDYAWKELGDNCKSVLQAFYYDNISLNDLALQLHKKPAAIRKQKQRCIEKLRTLFHKFANR